MTIDAEIPTTACLSSQEYIEIGILHGRHITFTNVSFGKPMVIFFNNEGQHNVMYTQELPTSFVIGDDLQMHVLGENVD